MRKFFDKKLNSILTIVVVVLVAAVLFQMIFAMGASSGGTSTADIATETRVNPAMNQIVSSIDEANVETTAEPTEATKVTETTVATEAETKKTEPTTKKPTEKPTETTVEPTTQKSTVAFATAIPVDEPADYNEQWAAGYLIAIDNPDKIYKCGQVTLSDYDRDLLERLCMGEFGVGGFVGASLIAQSVKNAMCFDGYTSVAAVIEDYHYTGSTDIPANEECKKAVRYIFDENHDAVQHRILYMYNPLLVDSEFHESQNYILTYDDVRFFDRWGY